MRKFSSYGPIDTTIEYYAPREELLQQICQQLLGDDPTNGGHFVTIWAPRQTGKSWITNQARLRLQQEHPEFDVVKLHLQDLSDQSADVAVYQSLVARINRALGYQLPLPTTQEEFAAAFSKDVLPKPLILILDEFDALQDSALRGVVGAFRNIYNIRRDESHSPTEERSYLLHGIALIGVRSVLGIGSTSRSPFNVQRSVHIPNLTEDEVRYIFEWYEKESGQRFASGVIDRIYYEMQGQPGLTCWMGELLTDKYNRHNTEITMLDFDRAYAAAIDELPNNNIVNIVSKAQMAEYRPFVIQMYQTAEKLPFRYDDPTTNFLYMNGVVDREIVNEDGREKRHLKFPNPFIQKRLFNFFAHELFQGLTRLYDPLEDLSDTITETEVNLSNVMRYYETYVHENRKWLFSNAPRRKTDERIYEAVYHFALYMYLNQFMRSYGSQVLPEFPTGNGQIDLLVRHGGTLYGVEVKSFANRREYQLALAQSAKYANSLSLNEIWLVLFIETIDDENRRQLETDYTDPKYNVIVHPVFVTIGSE